MFIEWRVSNERNFAVLRLENERVDTCSPAKNFTIDARFSFERWKHRRTGQITAPINALQRGVTLASLNIHFSTEPNYVTVWRLVNHTKSNCVLAKDILPYQRCYFDGLASVLLLCVLQSTLAPPLRHRDFFVTLTAQGTYYGAESNNHRRLARYYEKLGFKRSFDANEGQNDDDGIPMEAFADSIIQTTRRATCKKFTEF